MVERSLNGWPVIHSRSSKLLKTGTIPGTKIKITAHHAALPVLLAVAAEVHTRVKNLAANNAAGQDEGGYTYRAAGISSGWSDHSSGTAIDVNWRVWPMFKNAMTPAQRAACKLIERDFAPVIEWGGNWRRLDQMHWGIRKGISASFLQDWTKKHIGADGRLKK